MDTTFEQYIKLVQRFEGLRLRAYPDQIGVWTCGWGATGEGVTPTTIWTREQADARLLKDALLYFTGTQNLLPMLNGSALVAVSDFAYNLGLTRLKTSTLRKKILRGYYKDAANEFGKWVRAGGSILQDLVMRRGIEKNLFLQEYQ